MYKKYIVISLLIIPIILTGCNYTDNDKLSDKGNGNKDISYNTNKTIKLVNLITNNNSNNTDDNLLTGSITKSKIKKLLDNEFKTIYTCPISRISKKDEKDILKAMIYNLITNESRRRYYDKMINKGLISLNGGYFDGKVWWGNFYVNSDKETDQFFSIPSMIVAKENGKWKFILGSQDIVSCSIVKKYINLKYKRCLIKSFIRECFDDEKKKVYDLIKEKYK